MDTVCDYLYAHFDRLAKEASSFGIEKVFSVS